MFSSASIGKPNTRTGVLQISAPYAASLAAPFGVGGLITREYNALTMPLALMSSSSSVSLAHARHPLHKVPHRLGQTIARCTTSQSMALRAHTGAGSFGILNTFVRAGVDELGYNRVFENPLNTNVRVKYTILKFSQKILRIKKKGAFGM